MHLKTLKPRGWKGNIYSLAVVLLWLLDYAFLSASGSHWGLPSHRQWIPGTSTWTRYVSRAQRKMLSVCTTVKLDRACLKLIVPANSRIRGGWEVECWFRGGTRAGSQRSQILNPSQSVSKTCWLCHHPLWSSNAILDSLGVFFWGLF